MLNKFLASFSNFVSSWILFFEALSEYVLFTIHPKYWWYFGIYVIAVFESVIASLVFIHQYVFIGFVMGFTNTVFTCVGAGAIVNAINDIESRR